MIRERALGNDALVQAARGNRADLHAELQQLSEQELDHLIRSSTMLRGAAITQLLKRRSKTFPA